MQISRLPTLNSRLKQSLATLKRLIERILVYTGRRARETAHRDPPSINPAQGIVLRRRNPRSRVARFQRRARAGRFNCRRAAINPRADHVAARAIQKRDHLRNR